MLICLPACRIACAAACKHVGCVCCITHRLVTHHCQNHLSTTAPGLIPPLLLLLLLLLLCYPQQVLSTNANQDGTDICDKCGDNIMSRANDADEHPDAAPGAKAPATSASCFIKAGWGITFDPTDFAKFKAIAPCPANTYGVANETFGLINAPCKACTKNLYSLAGSTKFSDCLNPGGFGYTSEGANQVRRGLLLLLLLLLWFCPVLHICSAHINISDATVAAAVVVSNGHFASHELRNNGQHWLLEACYLSAPATPLAAQSLTTFLLLLYCLLFEFAHLQCPDGFWAAKDSMAPCEQCPPGKTTLYQPGNGTLQDSVADCFASEGNGAYEGNTTDPWNPANPSDPNLPARPCPIGFFSAGGAGAKCEQCPDSGSSSREGSATCDSEWMLLTLVQCARLPFCVDDAVLLVQELIPL
jgi:hypothetical protein